MTCGLHCLACTALVREKICQYSTPVMFCQPTNQREFNVYFVGLLPAAINKPNTTPRPNPVSAAASCRLLPARIYIGADCDWSTQKVCFIWSNKCVCCISIYLKIFFRCISLLSHKNFLNSSVICSALSQHLRTTSASDETGFSFPPPMSVSSDYWREKDTHYRNIIDRLCL